MLIIYNLLTKIIFYFLQIKQHCGYIQSKKKLTDGNLIFSEKDRGSKKKENGNYFCSEELDIALEWQFKGINKSV